MFRLGSLETKRGGYSHCHWTAGDGFFPGCTRSADALSTGFVRPPADWATTLGREEGEIQIMKSSGMLLRVVN